MENAPWKPLGTTVWFAFSVTVVCMDFWPGTVASKVIFVDCTPVTLLQSTLRKMRCSGELGEMEPWEGEISTQDWSLVAAHVKGEGPPAPMST